MFFKTQIVHAAEDQENIDALFGTINTPQGIEQINRQSGGDIGIIFFLSNMITLITIVGGLWILVNIVMAAFIYFTGQGKPDSHTKVRDKFTMSGIGLLLMIGSYLVAALIGLIFYGNANFILEPKL